MDDYDLHFDFERSLNKGVGTSRPLLRGPSRDAVPKIPELPSTAIGQQPGNYKKNYRQTVCTYWLKGLCMKGESCGFLHQLDPQRMPVCRAVLKYGVCKEPDCQFKHSLEDVKECNMFKLGFCIYGNNCRYKHTKLPGPPPDPEMLEAAKPREYRNINIVVNEVNPNIATGDPRPHKRPRFGADNGLNPVRGVDGQGMVNTEKMVGYRDQNSMGRGSDNRAMATFDPPPPPPGPPPKSRSGYGSQATQSSRKDSGRYHDGPLSFI